MKLEKKGKVMELEEYIEKLKPLVIKIFEQDSSGHDISHLERTMKKSKHIDNMMLKFVTNAVRIVLIIVLLMIVAN